MIKDKPSYSRDIERKNFIFFLSGMLLVIIFIFYFTSFKLKETQEYRSRAVSPSTSLNCVIKECTVSPVDLEEAAKEKYTKLPSVYSEADFANLEEALKAVKDQEGARLLLLAGREGKRKDAHVLITDFTVEETAAAMITKSLHLKGEVVKSLERMPRIVELKKFLINKYYIDSHRREAYNLCLEASKKPTLWMSQPFPQAIPGIWGYYQLELKKKGFYEGKGSAEKLCQEIAYEKYPDSMIGSYYYQEQALSYQPLLYFYKTANSSIENLVFDQKMMMPQDKNMNYYNDLNNILPVIKVEDSRLDLKNCWFNSRWNSDVAEVNIPVDLKQVRHNRIVAASYIRSKGTVELNSISGSWAGGVLAKESSEIIFKNNVLTGDWFAVVGLNSNLSFYSNAIFHLDGLRRMANGWKELKKQYPQWIGPLPLYDYPVNGIWLKGGSLVMENNTVGEYNATLRLEGLTNLKLINNVWLWGDNGGVVPGHVGGVVVDEQSKAIAIDTGNLDFPDGATPLIFDWDVCSIPSLKVTPVVGGVDRLSFSLCFLIPKKDSKVAYGKAGFTFGDYASGWNNWKFLEKEKGCQSLIQVYFPQFVCFEGLTCSSNQCLSGEEKIPSEDTQQPQPSVPVPKVPLPGRVSPIPIR